MDVNYLWWMINLNYVKWILKYLFFFNYIFFLYFYYQILITFIIFIHKQENIIITPFICLFIIVFKLRINIIYALSVMKQWITIFYLFNLFKRLSYLIDKLKKGQKHFFLLFFNNFIYLSNFQYIFPDILSLYHNIWFHIN